MPPTLRASCGVPVTVMASLNVTVTLAMSPALSVPFRMPKAEVMATEATVGAIVSMASVPPGLFVNVARLFCAESVIVAPLALSAVTVRSLVFSPAATVYVNTRAVDPLPEK